MYVLQSTCVVFLAAPMLIISCITTQVLMSRDSRLGSDDSRTEVKIEWLYIGGTTMI